jgi:hypothetical protein
MMQCKGGWSQAAEVSSLLWFVVVLGLEASRSLSCAGCHCGCLDAAGGLEWSIARLGAAKFACWDGSLVLERDLFAVVVGWASRY